MRRFLFLTTHRTLDYSVEEDESEADPKNLSPIDGQNTYRTN